MENEKPNAEINPKLYEAALSAKINPDDEFYDFVIKELTGLKNKCKDPEVVEQYQLMIRQVEEKKSFAKFDREKKNAPDKL